MGGIVGEKRLINNYVYGEREIALRAIYCIAELSRNDNKVITINIDFTGSKITQEVRPLPMEIISQTIECLGKETPCKHYEMQCLKELRRHLYEFPQSFGTLLCFRWQYGKNLLVFTDLDEETFLASVNQSFLEHYITLR